jgi:serine/threonine protein kinase
MTLPPTGTPDALARTAAATGELDVPPAGAALGRYRVLSPLGAGGMGIVLLAHDPVLDRKVALKLLRDSAGAPELHARLLREAQAMARLSHPSVVTVHDVGTTERGHVFLAMEHVDTLESRPGYTPTNATDRSRPR